MMAARQPDLVLSYIRIGPIYFPYCGNVLCLWEAVLARFVGADVPYSVAPSCLCVFPRKQGGSRPGHGGAFRPSAMPGPAAPRPRPALGRGVRLFSDEHEAQAGTGSRSPAAIPEPRSSAILRASIFVEFTICKSLPFRAIRRIPRKILHCESY